MYQDSILENVQNQLELTDKVIWEKDQTITKLKTIIKKQKGRELFFGFLGAMAGFVAFQILN